MSWKNTSKGYGWLSIAFHWLMLLLLVAVYLTQELRSNYPKGSSEREALAAWHYFLGVWVFLLVWLRLATRIAGATPAIEPPLPRLHALLARTGHWALYALMIAMPILGWLTLSAKGGTVLFFGVELPALIGKSERLAGQLRDVHEAGATAGYLLVGLHAIAALYHHYSRRDNTLKLMLGSG